MQTSVSPPQIFAAMAIAGVRCVLPPQGIYTVLAPIVESNVSDKPFFAQTFKSAITFSVVSANFKPDFFSNHLLLSSQISTFASCFTPFVFKNSREMSTIALPFKNIFILPVSVTTATGVAERFSSAASAINASTSFSATTTAIRSCDSEIASSVPFKPSYFLGTLSKSIFNPSASSPIATDTPPAPKSLHFLIFLVASLFKNKRWSFRSVSALPFCTSAPHVSTEWESCALEEPVAPPQPSRPVSPPSRIMMSPALGASR